MKHKSDQINICAFWRILRSTYSKVKSFKGAWFIDRHLIEI